MKKQKKQKRSSMPGIFPFIVIAGFFTLSLMAWQDHVDSMTGYNDETIAGLTDMLKQIDPDPVRQHTVPAKMRVTKLDTLAQINAAQNMLETFMADDGEPVKVLCGKKCGR